MQQSTVTGELTHENGARLLATDSVARGRVLRLHGLCCQWLRAIHCEPLLSFRRR